MYGLEAGASSLEVKDRQKKDRLGGLRREVQGSIEGLQAGLSTAQNEGVHIVRAFVLHYRNSKKHKLPYNP